MSNSLDPDQPDVLSGLICVQTVCKGYQQTTHNSKCMLSQIELSNRPMNAIRS